MEPEQEVIEQEQDSPTGEVVSPELAEEVSEDEVPVALEEDEDAEKVEGVEADTPAAHQFAKMRRERREAKRAAEEARLEAERWRGRAEALAESRQAKEEEVAAEPELVPADRPREDDFDDYGQFVEALADWKTEQKLTQREAERAKQEASKTKDAWLTNGNAKFNDFTAVVTKRAEDGGPAINYAMADFINSSPVSHEIAYHLAKNVNESRRIAGLSPMSAARELTKIESRFSKSTVAQTRKPTNAPAPIRPIVGDGATAVASEVDKMTTAEYIEYMNKKEFGARKQ
jgi:hypothetical protein